MRPYDAAAPVAGVLPAELGEFTLTVLVSVVVSLVVGGARLRRPIARIVLASPEAHDLRVFRSLFFRPRVHATGPGRGGVVAGVRLFDAGDPQLRAPDSIEKVYKHYGLVATAREGIRTLGSPGTYVDERHRETWIDLCSQASVEVSNSATQALDSLGVPVED